MNWVQWAIPLIGVAVWILSSMVKNQQDQVRRNANLPKKQNAEQAEDEAQRRANERANRLLEEIRRRKQREAPPPLPKVMPPREAPKRTVTTAQRIQDLDVALAARKATMSWQDPIAAPEVVAAPVIAVPLLASRTNVPPTITAHHQSKIVKNLQILLRNRQTLATAILLTEVMGPPRCKKHLRG